MNMANSPSGQSPPLLKPIEAMRPEELRDACKNPHWRLRNLYKIKNKDGQVVTFRPWPEQQRFLEAIWYRNLIPKARQRGFCAHPGLRVLTDDLRWVALGDIAPGDRLVAADEEPPGDRGYPRLLRTAIVEATRYVHERGLRLTLDNGVVLTVTLPHRLLAKVRGSVATCWRKAGKLEVGDELRTVTKPWIEGGFEDGWFGGFLDGDGGVRAKDGGGCEMAIAQLPGPRLERAGAYLAERGYHFREEIDVRNGAIKLVVGRIDELFRLAGQTRPQCARWPWWEGKKLPNNGWARIVAIEPVEPQRMIDLQTSEKTFILEGVVSHNSTVIQLMMMDACLFVKNTGAAIIAQDEDTARVIFEQKVRFAWDHLPDVVKGMVGIKYLTKTEMAFATDSSLVVATSTRGSTLQYLHVSEYGKICQRYPDRAAEIQTGSLPSVDQYGITCIESTVETPYGIFSDMVRGAQALELTGKALQPLDWKLHFASWWDAPEYEADPTGVAISPIDHAYFYRLEGEIRREIGPRKRAWYVLTRRNTFGDVQEKMWAQYPSTLDEAFTVSTDGLWLSAQMASARMQRRITKVPWDPGRPVNTFWDIGTSDDTAIWFHQDFGPRQHFINFIEGANEPPSYFVRQMNEMGYVYGWHYLPHDANHRRPGAEHLKTYVDLLRDLNVRNIEVVQRTPHVADGVDQLREAFGTYYIDEERCEAGIKHLDNFSKQWNDRTAQWMPLVMKNGHQHGADAIRQHAQIRHLRFAMLSGGKPVRRNKSGLAA